MVTVLLNDAAASRKQSENGQKINKAIKSGAVECLKEANTLLKSIELSESITLNTKRDYFSDNINKSPL